MEQLFDVNDYKFIYLILATLLVAFSAPGIKYNTWLEHDSDKNGYIGALVLAVFFTLYFGLRPQHGAAMTDTSGYVAGYYYDAAVRNPGPLTKEIVWHSIKLFMGHHGFPAAAWLTVVASIFLFFNLATTKRIFPSHIFIAYLFYITFFMFYQSGTNGIRNAAGYSIVLFGISLYYHPQKRNYLWMALLFLIGYQCHSSVAIIIASFLVSRYLVKSPKWAFVIWIAAIAISLVAGNALADILAANVEDERASKYLAMGQDTRSMTEDFSHTGFRWDFLLFSMLPMWLGYKAWKIYPKDKFYTTLLNTYILTNAVWVIFIYAKFNNRYAMLSWCFYSYVLAYPLLKLQIWDKVKQKHVTIGMMCLMLAFTYYMLLKY